MSKLYKSSGYPDIEYLDSRGLPFNILVGGRGIGKTYGLLEYYINRRETIIYMRRTAEQTKIAKSVDYTPYKKVCDNLGIGYDIPRGQNALYTDVMEKPTCYFMPLSTFGNVRGFDGSDCAAIVYDEFIPESTARPIKEEETALFNAYETINRNRELEGAPPVKLWLLSNTNNIVSPVLRGLGLLEIAMKLERSQQEQFIDRKRGIQYISFFDSPISVKKSETALYRLTNHTGFRKMALQNSYNFEGSDIKSRDLRQYKILCKIWDIYLYEHKADGIFYVSHHKSGTPEIYGTDERETKRFLRDHPYIYEAAILGDIEYEDMDCFYEMQIILSL